VPPAMVLMRVGVVPTISYTLNPLRFVTVVPSVFSVGAVHVRVAVVSGAVVHVRVYVVGTRIGVTARVPDVATGPVHLVSDGLDDATQLATPVEDQVSVGVIGVISVSVAALSVTVGTV